MNLAERITITILDYLMDKKIITGETKMNHQLIIAEKIKNIIEEKNK
jgi:hypothetical protein